MEKSNVKSALWTPDFIWVFLSNLLMFFSFYMLVPVLPFYVLDNLGTTETVAGLVLSLYTIAALVIRPFSGFLVDHFSRKPLYLICYACFCAVFAGYIVTTTLLFFIVFRILHGFAFGICTVSGSTVAVDIMPSERRGEGIGYYGMAGSIAMALGPMTGLWLYQYYSFPVIFLAALIASLAGFVMILFIAPIAKIPVKHEETKVLSWDRFILLKGLPCVALFFLSGFGYGAVSNFIGLYCEQMGFEGKAGLFFLILAGGIIVARIISAKPLNEGKIVRTIYRGSALIILAFVLFVFSTNDCLFFLVALLFGAGYGQIMPAFQSMLINLARHDQRGTANATYFIFWDLGIGLGIASGGSIIENLGFRWLFIICAGLVLLGVVYFVGQSVSYYGRNKIH